MGGSFNARDEDSTARAFYVEEKVRFKESPQSQALLVLRELLRQQEDFLGVAEMESGGRETHFAERVGLRKRVRVSFGNEEEIELVR